MAKAGNLTPNGFSFNGGDPINKVDPSGHGSDDNKHDINIEKKHWAREHFGEHLAGEKLNK